MGIALDPSTDPSHFLTAHLTDGMAAKIQAIIVAVNNQAVDYTRPSRWLGYPMNRLIALSASRFVTGSMATARQLNKVLRLNEVKCLVLHNDITLHQATESRGETRKHLDLDKFGWVTFGVVAILRDTKCCSKRWSSLWERQKHLISKS